MKKLVLGLLLTTFLSVSAYSQMTMAMGEDYKLGIGFRGGFSNGVNIKYFLDTGGGHALEGIVGASWGRVDLTVLYEKQQHLGNVTGLDWYFGGGGHIRNYGPGYKNYSNSWHYYSGPGDGMHVGIDGIIGLEYKIIDFPLAISADFKPFYELDLDGKGFIQSDFALSLRFTLD